MAGAGIGLSMVVCLVILGAVLQAGVAEQIRRTYGDADLMVGYRELGDHLTQDEVAYIGGLPEVKSIGQVFLPFLGQGNAETLGAVYAGVSNDALALDAFRIPQPLQPHQVVLTADLAARLGAETGARVALPFPGGQSVTWEVAAVIDLPLRADSPEMAFFHLPTLQQALRADGAVTYLYVDLFPGADKLLFARDLQLRWGEDLRIDTMDGLDELRANLGGLRNIGLALSVLALVVAALSMVTVVQIQLRQRLRDIAILRSVGASQRQVAASFLREVAYVATGATALAVVFGAGLALLLTGAVSGWLEVEPPPLRVPWIPVLVVACTGWLWLILTGFLPVWRVAGLRPLAALASQDDGRGRRGRLWVPAVFWGLAALLQVAALRLAPASSSLRAAMGLLSGVLWVVSVFASSWLILVGIAAILRPLLLRFGSGSHVALKNLTGSQPRTRLATIVLAGGVALATGAFVLIDTLNAQVSAALEREFATPLVVSSSAIMDSTLPLSLEGEIERIDGVAEAIPWGIPFGMPSEDRRMSLSIVPVDLAGLARLGLLEGLRPDEVAGVAVISRALADDLGLKVGDRLDLDAAASKRSEMERLTLRVGAVVGSPIGRSTPSMVLVDWSTLQLKPQYTQLWMIMVEPQADSASVDSAALDALAVKYPELRWRTEDQAKAQLSRQIRERLALFWGAVLTIVLVGALTAANTISALLRERVHEHAVLRAIGVSPLQLARTIFVEISLQGLGAIVVGMVAGLGFTVLFARTLGQASVTLSGKSMVGVIVMTWGLMAGVGLSFARQVSKAPVTRLLAED